MPRPTDTARNQAIARAHLREGKSLSDLANLYGVDRSTISRAVNKYKRSEAFAADNVPSLAGGAVFSEMATTGLRHFGGSITEEYDRVFKSLNKRVALYKEMGDDPIVAAVLQAIRMTLRRVGWYVQAGGESKADEEAAEFLETCMDDMSQTWNDSIDSALDMMQYGFQLAELVYKRRQGPKEEAGSKYDDNRIGWRKWVYIAPDSLAPGDEWIFDESNGLQGFNQQDIYKPGGSVKIAVPIAKAILFRPTQARSNPEGRSLLRAMYRPWFFKSNLEEIEGISAERLGAGFPVIYAGTDVGKGTGTGGDLETLKDIVRNVRVDEQMGLVLPWAKMGGGAAEGKGVLFELVSPPGRGAVNFHETIGRHEQRMAMVGLAQFIHLGMNQVGAKSLGESSTDFFTLAVGAWADGIADTINRYAVDRLMRLNAFPGLTANPTIKHESVTGTNLIQVADYINKLAGAQLISPSMELEKHLLELADLPDDHVEQAYELRQKQEAEAKAQQAAQLEQARKLAEQRQAITPPVQPPNPDNTPEVVEGEEPEESNYGANMDVFSDLRRALKELDKQQDAEKFTATLAALRGPGITIQNATMPLPDNFAFPAPVVNVDMKPVTEAFEALAQTPPNVVVNVPAPVVHVAAPIIPAPVINIPAPVVNIPPQPAPIVNVHPELTAKIEMPETVEETTISRDKEGFITGTTKTRKKKGKVA